MKHTPGPWKFEKSTKTIRSVPPNYWLATMDSWDGAVDHDANAKLIAAAPELLDACQDLLEQIQPLRCINITTKKETGIKVMKALRAIKSAT